MALGEVMRAAASWDTLLVFLAIVLISAASNWLKRRNQPREGEEWTEPEEVPGPASPRPPPPGGARPDRSAPATPSVPEGEVLPRRLGDWEQELRRLLGEEVEAPRRPLSPSPSAPPVTQPKPSVTPGPSPTPAPATPTQRRPETVRGSAPPPLSRPGTHEPFASQDRVLAEVGGEAFIGVKSSRLHDQVAERMRRIDERTRQPSVEQATPRREASAGARELSQILRRPALARQAILASVILAPPKALE